MKMKKAWCIALAAAMTFMSVMPAFAADTKIDTVKLTFSYDTAPASGDSIGSIHVSGDTSSYYVESAEYTNADDQDTWTVGDIPEVKVELYAKDGYRFSYTSKSHFKLSGCNAEFKKAGRTATTAEPTKTAPVVAIRFVIMEPQMAMVETTSA